jgi:hypothetical protein
MRLTCTLLLIILLSAASVEAKLNQATFTFLRISPSAQANGRSFGIVPGNYYDPFVSYYNPAAQGYLAKQNLFSGALGYAKWHPWWFNDDMSVTTAGMNAGIASEKGPMLCGKRGVMYYGAGVQFLFYNLGKIQQVDEQARPIGSFDAYEWASGISLGAMMEHYVRLGIGLTGKFAFSKLGTNADSKASAPMVDSGLILEVPILKSGQKSSPKIAWGNSSIEPELVAAFNYALLNFGGKVAYDEDNDGDPLPRTAAVGLGMTAALSQSLPDGGRWRWICLSAGMDANDDLIRRDDEGHSHYRAEPFGDINLLTDFIASQNDDDFIKSYGVEIGLLETLCLRTGYYSDHEERVFYHTYGSGLHLSGLLKGLRLLGSPSFASLAASLKGVDVSYDVSVYDTCENNPLDETTFHMLTFRLER